MAIVESYLSRQLAAQHVPGMSLAIVEKDGTTLVRAFGMADVENGVPATPETVYRIGSMTRFVTAVAILQLVQEGKLSLRTRIREYVPELPDNAHAITIEHLLAQQSGIRTYQSGDELYNKTGYHRLVDVLPVFKDDPLLFAPGARFMATPFGYHLLGLVLERIRGKAFGSCLREHVFEPLGMTSTRLDSHSDIIQNRASGYLLRRKQRLQNSPYVDLSNRYPSDGLVSTVSDMARFARAWMDAKLIPPEFLTLMTTAYRTSQDEPTRYGLGCFVRDERGQRIVGHAGWQPGANGMLLIVPEQSIAVVMLTNLEQADVQRMSLDVVDLLLGRDLPPADARTPSASASDSGRQNSSADPRRE